MLAPDFWWRKGPSLLAVMLAPVGAVYGSMTAHRMARTGLRLEVPVVCVGNFVVGGAGKTPAAIAVARLLQAQGHRPAFLSRGYGRDRRRTSAAVIAVDPDRHDAGLCGDEPLLLARVAPTFVAVDRRASARAAVAAGASILVLDDGLQNPTLRKDVSIAVVDGTAGIGNGLCVPAGPLRAPLARQWRFTSLLCVVGKGEAGRALEAQARNAGVAVCTGHLAPDPEAIGRLRGRRLVAFAGIGRPSKFFATLAEAGLDAVEHRWFPDHHVYSPDDRAALRQMADQFGARLVTTAKDRVRLPPDFDVEVVPVELVFDAPAILEERLYSLTTAR